jgi:hypothetical protein
MTAIIKMASAIKKGIILLCFNCLVLRYNEVTYFFIINLFNYCIAMLHGIIRTKKAGFNTGLCGCVCKYVIQIYLSFF